MKCDFKLNQGLNRMRMSQQPGMIIIYKSWCPVCTELKERLAISKEIDQLSNYIVMVVLKDNDEPEDRAFTPDGGYIPRVFFTNPDGRILYDIFNNKGDPRKNFGTNLKWETNLERGLQKIVSRQKPGMIVVHKSWCGACRNLKPKFEASKDIQNLSGGFVLISLSDDNHPKDLKYMPDGDYVPRIMFINPQGSLLVEVINQDGSTEYKYFYSDAESIARSMKHVLNQYPDR
ncbi:hypothetical protein RUM43_002747 [Polyplax serrata]|uniref:Thioredoxin domain-containing protein n=1 Tax=Polyplax serrata TaxID=468196 RepID=A0AAN8P2K9_POLSC